jgi:hypothetical protein
LPEPDVVLIGGEAAVLGVPPDSVVASVDAVVTKVAGAVVALSGAAEVRVVGTVVVAALVAKAVVAVVRQHICPG